MKRAQQKEAKILKRFPQIKACSVRIVRSPRIDKMGETPLNYRRSTRIIINSQNRAIQTPQKVNKKGKLTSKSAVKQRSTLKSILIDKKCARRGRSKSVSFYLQESDEGDENDFIARQNPNVCRTLFADFSVGTTSTPPPAHVASAVDLTSHSTVSALNLAPDVAQDVAIDLTKSAAATSQTVQQASAASNDHIRGLENRIECLVESNQSKINRIKLILAERSSLLSEVETLNRLNRSMTEALDMYRNEDIENRPPTDDDRILQMDSQIGELKTEVQSLKDRIGRLNQSNFQLDQENKRLKSVLRTHSSRVSSEHNYQM